jgi:GntR family transcriptional regulator / MocR family aminotransferase
LLTLDFPLDRGGTETLDRQLYNHIRREILSGNMKPGEKVVSTRELAESLGVSRSTAVAAYKQLIAEGYLDARAKSSTFVCLELPETNNTSVQGKLASKLTDLGKKLIRTEFVEVSYEAEELEIPFYSWRTALEELPLEQWSKNLGRRYRISDPNVVDWSPRVGSPRLRIALAEMVRQTRGIECEPEQVITTLGYQQALDLLCRVFVSKGDLVAVENPCFTETRVGLSAHGADLVPIDVDESGLIVEQLASRSKSDIKLVSLTPSHQFPTGAILPMTRRLELLEWSRKTGALILEDDYDSEYRYVGQPIPALAGLTDNNLVVYVGSFSKVLYTSFGIGYMVVPKALTRVFENVRRLAADPLPLQMQEAVADFIEEGHLKRHIKHMRPIYEERRSSLIHSLQQHLGSRVTVYGDSSGLHVMARIKTLIPDQVLVGRCAKAGVGLLSTSGCYMNNPQKGEFIFGYGNLNPETIREGIRRLGSIVSHSD